MKRPIPFPEDFAAEERRQALEDSQPLNAWGVFIALVTTITFWGVVIGLAVAAFVTPRPQ